MPADTSQTLETIFLSLLPEDGKAVGNATLQARFEERLREEGLLDLELVETHFQGTRERLLSKGLVIKGKGRGGATARTANAASAPEDFGLLPEVPTGEDAGAGRQRPKNKRKAPSAASTDEAQVLSYRHADKRKNNPEVGLVNTTSDPEQPKKTWAYNPHLDPVLNFDPSRAELESQVADALASGDPAVMKATLEEIQRRGAPYLQWAGKAERTSFEVDTVSLHVHERIDPMSILSAVRKGGADKNGIPADEANLRQASLFEAPFENLPLRDAVDFYRHDKGWANRLVSGDSLQVMNSLLVKEGMAGQVQMVYFDPPYGIKYGSNFQPFVGKRDVKDRNDAEGLFTWVVSDFGLNDAIEAGLVKTPRVVVRDDALPNAQTYRSKLYHLYREPEVQEDLNRRGAEPHEALPKLVQDAYTLLGADWRAALLEWQKAGHASPPVMLTVCNRVETAARIEHYLNHGDAHWTELKAPERTLRVDSRVLEKAEIGEKASGESVFKARLSSLLKVLQLPESVADKLDAAKKDGDKLQLLAQHVGLKAEDRKRFDEQQVDDQLVTLIQAAPIVASVKDYLLGTTEYVNRLREIVKAAKLPKDREERLLALDKEDLLRSIVDSVGKHGQAGQGLQSVISVAMLSEGWDAKNVTHIMGLRAFTSQLLCEQVIGRGLRRVGYDRDENGLFVPEYVNVFGVPLSVFVDANDGGDPPPPPKPSTQIESLASRNELEVRWPNLLRVDTVVKPTLAVAWSTVPSLRLDPALTPISAELAPAVGGATDLGKTTSIDLEKLPEDFRAQRIIFQAARKAFDQMSGRFKGNREYLVFQLIRLVEQFISPQANKLDIPSLYHSDGLRRRILIALNADLVVQHLVKHVEQQNVASIEPVFDPEQPIGSTRTMRTWYTTKGNQPTKKSQVSHVVGDSSWEIYAANIFDASDLVSAYAKNDHLGFQIYYLWGGSRRRFLPDFIVRLSNGKTLVLEIKGEDSPQNVAKRDALKLWVDAVNAKGGFETWCWDVAFEPAQIIDILQRHSQ